MRIEYFQLIDRVESVDDALPGLTASANVPAETTIFEGHFPGYPIMPGVLLIESMAQAAGYCILRLNHFATMPFLISVKDAKLRNFVEPDSAIEISTVLDHQGSGYAFSKTSIRRDGALVCNALLGMRLLPFPDPALLEHVRAQAKRIGLPERADA